MLRVIASSRFERKLKKRVESSKQERDKLFTLIKKLSENPSDISLNVHKLKGKLKNMYSCSCGYDCRIIFSIEKDRFDEEFLLLIDIGTHDEVY